MLFPATPNSESGEFVADPLLIDPRIGKSFIQRVKLHLRSDEELVSDLLDHEPDALTVLFDRHAPLVFRVARRILRNDSEAEDAVQQIFMDVFLSAQQFDPNKGSFKTWLLMFAYHRTFSARRRLSVRGFYVSESIEDNLPEQLVEGVNCSIPIPSAELCVLVNEILGHAQPRQRRVIELTYYEGLTAEEISERTGESVRVVRHHLYRGLEKLRVVLRSKVSGKKKQSKRTQK